ALYETYGFRTWLRELTGDAQRIPVNDHRVGGVPAAAVTTDTQNELSEEPERQYQTITTEDALAQLWQSIQKAEIVALDTETTSLNAFEAEIVGVSVSTAPGQAAYIPLAHRGVEGVDQLHKSTVWKVLKPRLESTQHAKVLQIAKYD